MSIRWALISLLLCCSYRLSQCLANCQGRCVRSPAGQLFRLIPVRLYVPEQLEDDVELLRQPRQQQFVQEVVVENNFGAPGGGFGGPPPFGGPQFGAPPFGAPGFGRGGFGRGGGGFGGGFGGAFGGSFGGGFGRSYESEEEEQPQQPTPAKCNVPSVPVPPCANSYVFSCEAAIKPVPCAAPDAKCGY